MKILKLTIFFSWQSETHSKYNRNFILNCIEKVIKILSKRPEFEMIEFKVEEGVKGEPGSPAVASKINNQRIPNCDIFIADLSVVNQIGWFTKLIQRCFDRKKFRPYQNNNVIVEYGVAYNALGPERIISVLNNAYGSPNENPDNIPFDIRHLRFPIPYNYSPRSKEELKQNASKELIDGLTSAIHDTAIYALKKQKSKYNPFIVWSDWGETFATMEPFVLNPKIEEIKQTIGQGLKDSSSTMRILGLSGLGKTRIVLEVFRPVEGDSESIIRSSRVLYINCNLYPTANYDAIFTKLDSDQEARIVILDNCSIEIHRQAVSFSRRDQNRTLFISIDSNPEEITHTKMEGVNYIVITKDELTTVVDEILKRDFGGIGEENINKIKEFSQGIPLMAVLLAESTKNGEQYIGKLEDKLLLDKLLGTKGQDARSRSILKACSIFNYFGFTDELSSQAEFIAKDKNITSIDGDDTVIVNEFNVVCNYYLKREIFERKGRFIAMRPFPLALSLAQEWLESCTPQRLTEILTSIANLTEPNRRSLSEALAEQMKYLGYDEKAVEIVEKITGPGSPFDNAEVLNTELGSRLFRSFVEVNPVAVSQNLSRLFSDKSTEELLKVSEGRRNLVWILEKLCFDKRTFNISIKTLYSFAVAENETWANNATGQFLHLFNILLSGTEANLSDRWAIIEWGLNKNDDRYYQLALKAMRSGLTTHHFSRMQGAENQGAKRLNDYEPKHSEIEEYWGRILNKLYEMAISENNNYSGLACDIIADNIRGLFSVRMGKLVIPYLHSISEFKKYDWDNGLRALKAARRYEKNLILEDQLLIIDELIQKLTKTDFISKYKNIGSYNIDRGEPYSGEKIKSLIIDLADEFINTNVSWEESLPSLYQYQQTYSYYFGRRLYEVLGTDQEKAKRFLKLSKDVISQVPKEKRDVTILGGFIAEASFEIKAPFYAELFELDELNYLLFYFISVDTKGIEYLDLLFDLVNLKKCDLRLFLSFRYSKVLTDLNPNELTKFSERFFKYGREGYEVAFDLLSDIAYHDDTKRTSLIPVLKDCIFHLGIGSEGSVDTYKLTEIISFIISEPNQVEFAKFLNHYVITSINIKNLYHLDDQAQKIYEILMKVHFNSIWPELSQALMSVKEEYVKFYGLKHILGSRIGGIARTIGVLFSGDIDVIFEWCHDSSPLAPSRLAELVPIFNPNTQDSEWHPVTLRLINEFGGIPDVLANISINMSNFSWTGSVVPLLESKRKLFERLINHERNEVRNWSEIQIGYINREIEIERNNDAEAFLY